jgi:hypothetical protein
MRRYYAEGWPLASAGIFCGTGRLLAPPAARLPPANARMRQSAVGIGSEVHYNSNKLMRARRIVDAAGT